MKLTSIGLLIGAARKSFAVLVFFLTVGLAPAVWAQEELEAAAPAAEEAAVEEAAPAEEGAVAEEAPVAEETPAEAAVETIPVENAEAVPTPPVAPASEGATELDTIEVTGSRIKRTDYETSQPVLVIKREDIDRAGLVSIGDLLQNLPQAGASLSRSFNNGGNGSTTINLRNLGSQRVLVLVNGRRWVGAVSQFGTSSVDLNTIPISVIDSIEVLKDGASAVYGSDAIAGVINIKTRRDFVGAEVRGHIEQMLEQGDGLQAATSFAGGTVAGKTSVFFDVSYVLQEPLLAGERKQSSIPVLGTGPLSRGSSFTPYGRLLFVPTSDNGNAINAALGTTSNAFGACRDLTAGVADNTVQSGTVVSGQRVPGTGTDPNVPPPPASGLTLCDLSPRLTDFRPGQITFQRFDQLVHGHNYAPVNYLITPQERTSIFGQISHQITDQVRFSSEVLFNIRQSSQELAETPFAGGDVFRGVAPFDVGYLARDNPFNPTNPSSPYYIEGTQPQDIGLSAAGPGATGPGLGVYLRRFTELGARKFRQKVDTYRIGGGLDGSFDGKLDTRFAGLNNALNPILDRFFSWDGGYAFTENKLISTDAGLLDATRVARATGPLASCIGTAATARPLEATGCVPLDVVGGPGTITPAMLNYIKYTAIDTSRQSQKLAYGNISTEIGELSRWLPGPVGMAMGVEFRREFFQSVPDPLKAIARSSTNALSATQGSYDAKEAYLEFNVPVLEDVSFDEVPGLNKIAWLKGRSLVQDLELSTAGRYSNYTGFGDNFSHKFGLRYKPYEDLIFRATASDAFRAPAITDLFLGAATSFPLVGDICRDRNQARRGTEPGIDNVKANCTADGVPDTVTSNAQVATTFGGNPDLEPETAKTLSMGLVYSPSFLPDFNAYLDAYRIELEQFIGVVGPGLVQELCYRSPSNQRIFCDLHTRNPGTKALTSFNALFRNFAALELKGVDLNLDWILPLPEQFKEFGTFQWLMDAAYVTQYDVLTPSGLGPRRDSLVGLVVSPFGGGIPRLKANTGLNWRLGDWEATWNVRYIYHVYEICNDGRQNIGAANGGSNPQPIPSLEELGLCSGPRHPQLGLLNKIDKRFYNDVQGIYNLPNWNMKLTFGVINVLNQDPPAQYTAFADSYDKGSYDPWDSRSPYLRFQVNF